MSILHETREGWVISHQKFLENCYAKAKFAPKSELFLINTPYLKEAQAEKLGRQLMTAENESDSERGAKTFKLDAQQVIKQDKGSEVNQVTQQFNKLIKSAYEEGHFKFSPTIEDLFENNSESRCFSDDVFKLSRLSGQFASMFGKNDLDIPVIKKIQGDDYILPPNSSYFCGDIFKIDNEYLEYKDFNLAIIDPPWWNKYIRRRKAAKKSLSYDMLSNEDLSKIPIFGLLSPGALVAVWCTNSPNNITGLMDIILPSWGLEYVASWFWVKVDRSGSTVCKFSKPPGKQPYERIIFARKPGSTPQVKNPVEGKIIVSVPSAIHSHKPPLNDLLFPFVSGEPKVLELFARSLLPNTTSCGYEVLKLQHNLLFQKVDDKGKTGLF